MNAFKKGGMSDFSTYVGISVVINDEKFVT
jgi:hypothetical protein